VVGYWDEVDWVGVRRREGRWWWEVSETRVKERDSEGSWVGGDVEGAPGENVENVCGMGRSNVLI